MFVHVHKSFSSERQEQGGMGRGKSRCMMLAQMCRWHTCDGLQGRSRETMPRCMCMCRCRWHAQVA